MFDKQPSFIRNIFALNPNVERQVLNYLDDWGHKDDQPSQSILEALAMLVTNAVKERNEELALCYLRYMSEQLEHTSKLQQEFIETYFVEALLLGVSDEATLQYGWSLFPENIKESYCFVIGHPPI